MGIDYILVWDVLYYTDDIVVSDTDSNVQLYTVLLYRILLQFVLLLELLYLWNSYRRMEL